MAREIELSGESMVMIKCWMYFVKPELPEILTLEPLNLRELYAKQLKPMDLFDSLTDLNRNLLPKDGILNY